MLKDYEKIAREVRRKFHLKLWNSYNFFVTYANLDAWSPSGPKSLKGRRQNSSNILDKWILERLVQTITGVTNKLKKYDAYNASLILEDFVDDLSNWYIRRSRERVGPTQVDKKDRDSFYETTYAILTTLCKLLAPFIPFITEVIYRNLTKEESVHLGNWPKGKSHFDKKLLLDMENIRQVVEKVHAIRKDKNIPVRQPLKSLITKAPFSPPENLKVLLMDEINVKEWIVTKGKSLENTLDTTITNELREEAKTRELIRNVQLERRKKGMELAEKITLTVPWLPKSKALVQILKSKTLTNNLKIGKFKIAKSPR